jgi:hypothetical protein
VFDQLEIQLVQVFEAAFRWFMLSRKVRNSLSLYQRVVYNQGVLIVPLGFFEESIKADSYLL